MTSNPEILLEGSSEKISSSALSSECVTVNQNLMWVSQIKGKPKEWEIDLINDDLISKIGNITLTDSPNTMAKKRP